MISAEQAQKTILDHIGKGEPKCHLLEEAHGLFLAEEIISPLNLPMFDQSAMDGYAINNPSSLQESAGKIFKIQGEIKAGDSPASALPENEAVALRIFTGAPVPKRTFAVIPQEEVETTGQYMTATSDRLEEGKHIRRAGNQVQKGDVLLEKNTKLNPAAIGLLASTGISKVWVYPSPSIAIMTTGNELVNPGCKLKEGSIYESNSAMLKAAIGASNGHVIKCISVSDSEWLIRDELRKILNFPPDILLITGGVSVGKYDFVKEALVKNGTTLLFEKVAQKPGKPLVFGKKGKTRIFGLPGNPAAVLSCFYHYVYPAMAKMGNLPGYELPFIYLPLAKEISKRKEKTTFLRVQIEDGQAFPLEGQSSDNLMAFASADGIAQLPENQSLVPAGAEVKIRILPGKEHYVVKNSYELQQ